MDKHFVLIYDCLWSKLYAFFKSAQAASISFFVFCFVLFFFSFFLPFCLFPVFHIFFLLSLIYFVYLFLSLWVVFFYCSIVLLNNYKICNLSLTYLFMHPIYIYSYFSYWQFLYIFFTYLQLYLHTYIFVHTTRLLLIVSMNQLYLEKSCYFVCSLLDRFLSFVGHIVKSILRCYIIDGPLLTVF